MSKLRTRFYDCLKCKEYDSVRVTAELKDTGVEVIVYKCTVCGQFHNIDDENNLVMLNKNEDGKE
jgi:transcription elongation factor Elf1